MNRTLNDQLLKALRDGKHDEAKRLVKAGTNVNFVNVFGERHFSIDSARQAI
jgi:hypothetical protein